MGTYALSFVFLMMAFPGPSSSQDRLTECGVRVAVETGLKLTRDDDAEAPLCVLRGEGGPAVPLTKSITVLRWDQISRLHVNGIVLRDIGFFRLAKNKSVTFFGRPTYEDSRNTYSQQVVGRPVQSTVVLVDGSHRLLVRTELHVKWLRPVTADVQDDVDQSIVCFDSATLNQDRFAIFNWCVPKHDQALNLVKRMAESLTLTDR